MHCWCCRYCSHCWECATASAAAGAAARWIAAALARRGAISGVLTGLGVLAKVYPAALLPAALTWLGPGGRLRRLASAAAVVVLGLTPFVLLSPAVVQTSARVMASRPPYETPWVFLEGCCFDGRMPDPAQRDATLPDLPRTAAWCPGRW